MIHQQLPADIALLEFVSTHLERCIALFQNNTEAYKSFRQALKEDNDSALDHPEHGQTLTTYLQLILLCNCSMAGGISAPLVHQIHISNEQVKLRWKTQQSNELELGQNSRQFHKFAQALRIKLLSKSKRIPLLSSQALEEQCLLLKDHIQQLSDAQRSILDILNTGQSIQDQLPAMPMAFVFTVLTCLPNPSMSRIVNKAKELFNEDLAIKANHEHEIHINQFLSKPSEEFNVNLSKIQLLFNLQFFSELDDIKSQLQTDLIQWIREEISGDHDISSMIQSHLHELAHHHLGTKIQLFDCFYKNITEQITPLPSNA